MRHFMKKRSAILIFTLILGLFACKEKHDRLSSKSVSEVVRAIANTNVVMGSAVGYGAQRPEQWDRYAVLRSKATDKELLALTNDTNSVVRCYAFQALVERNRTDIFPILLLHLSDTATVHTLYGCIGDSQKVGDFFLERVTESGANGKFYQLNDKQKVIIDSLLLFEDGNNLEARDKLLATLQPLTQYYVRVRHLAVKENNKPAVLALAKFKRQEDKTLIEELLTDANDQSYGFAAVVSFPDPSFFPALQQALKNEATKKTSNGNNRLQLLYDAIVQYKGQPSRELLESTLQELTGMQWIYHADYLHQALRMYPSEIYDGLLKPVFTVNSMEKSGT